MKTRSVDGKKLVTHLRDKHYEDAFLDNHDETQNSAPMAIDLREYNEPDLVQRILKFNQLLFSQIGSKNDVNLKFFY